MNAYEILGVVHDSDDATIRKAYLSLIKEHTPDRDPEGFKRYNRAYESIKDEDSRVRYFLFSRDIDTASPLDAVIDSYRLAGSRNPLPFNSFMRILNECKTKKT